MTNFFHKKGCSTDTNSARLEPLPIPLIKETYTGKSDGDYVKLKLHRYPTSGTLEIYEFMMSLFDHGNPEEFLLFVRNFEMTLAATGMLEMKAKVHYLRMLVRGGALRQFDLLSTYV